MNVAFIPVRGGSKSIPLKNIKPICGKPLVYWSIKAACECGYIDKVYVATDSEAIVTVVNKIKCDKELPNSEKIEVIGRSSESATDTASTEYAMLEFAAKFDFDNIVLIQATSPLLQAKDIDKGFILINDKRADSVISVVRQKRFNWKYSDEDVVVPTNYDVFKRPRRQEFEGYLVENGAFYITKKNLLLKTKNRVSGLIRAVEMDEDSFFEIDEPSDWIVIEALMKKKLKRKICPNKIKVVLTDCDGCLTDGGMYYSEEGDELKKFNTKDGMGFKLLHEKGIFTGIITSEKVNLNRRRADKMKLNILIDGCVNKLEAVQRLCCEKNISISDVCYVGDDINDLELLKTVGFSCAPADAISQVKESVDYITKAKGGEGVIREIVDYLIDNCLNNVQ